MSDSGIGVMAKLLEVSQLWDRRMATRVLKGGLCNLASLLTKT